MRHFIAQLEKFSLNFSSLLLKFKMASLPGTKAHGKPHGGKRENCGRKKKFQGDQEAKKAWNSSHKRIYLTQTIFQSWVEAKHLAGYRSCSNSDFAAHLLSLEYRRK